MIDFNLTKDNLNKTKEDAHSVTIPVPNDVIYKIFDDEIDTLIHKVYPDIGMLLSNKNCIAVDLDKH